MLNVLCTPSIDVTVLMLSLKMFKHEYQIYKFICINSNIF